jgi:hypothetical protein
MERKTRVYQYIIVGLILLNVLMITWQWFGAQRRPPRPQDILRKELQLTDVQMNAYQEMIREHRVIADPLERDIAALRKQLLNYDATDSGKQAVADAVGKKQAEFEMSLYKHFKKVRALCNEEQQKKFDEVLFRALAAGRPPRPKPSVWN